METRIGSVAYWTNKLIRSVLKKNEVALFWLNRTYCFLAFYLQLFR